MCTMKLFNLYSNSELNKDNLYISNIYKVV